jgi:hypothetical protein
VIIVISIENILVIIWNTHIATTVQYTKIRKTRLAHDLTHKKGGDSPTNTIIIAHYTRILALNAIAPTIL